MLLGFHRVLRERIGERTREVNDLVRASVGSYEGILQGGHAGRGNGPAGPLLAYFRRSIPRQQNMNQGGACRSIGLNLTNYRREGEPSAWGGASA